MKAMLTYDISGHQSSVKNELINLGYADRWTYQNHVVSLPNTTLWKNNIAPSQAIIDIERIVGILNQQLPANDQIRIERAVAVGFDTWHAFWGDPHQSQNQAPNI